MRVVTGGLILLSGRLNGRLARAPGARCSSVTAKFGRLSPTKIRLRLRPTTIAARRRSEIPNRTLLRQASAKALSTTSTMAGPEFDTTGNARD
jgi:hypothetical protein